MIRVDEETINKKTRRASKGAVKAEEIIRRFKDERRGRIAVDASAAIKWFAEKMALKKPR
ncbi:MAG: hypothetical protein QW057_07865 [Candidatus Bathyarchaeia archaeon]